MANLSKKVSFQTRLAAGFTSLIVIILAMAFSVFYIETRSTLHESLRSKLISIASTAALTVNPEDHILLKIPQDEKSPAYQRVKARLQHVKKANPQIRFVYTMVKTKMPNKWMYVVDAETNPNLTSHLGDLEDVTHWESLKSAYRGPTADEEIEKDEWGYSLSGYAPVYDKYGNTIAVLGVDMSVDNVVAEEDRMTRVIGVIFIIALILTLLLCRFISRIFCEPIYSLVAGTKAVSQDNLEYELKEYSSQELNELANSFNTMVSVIKANKQRLQNQASTDELTELYNHRHFQYCLEQQIKISGNKNESFCLLFCDMDNFKIHNDLYGHLKGDQLLHKIAKILIEVIPPDALAFRYGGEEFAIILPGRDEEEGALIAEDIRHRVENYSSDIIPHSKFLLTISIGLSVYPHDSKQKNELIDKSDRAMYYAKEMGRNQVRIYSREQANMGTLAKEEAARKDLLLNAIHALRAAVDAKDHYTLEHSESVAKYAVAIARCMNLPEEEIHNINLAAILHDVGKIGVTDNILQKAASLSPQERKIIQTHPVVGANILKHIPSIQHLIPLVLFHHERFDGSGYPNGLKGERIPLGARILGVADAFHAMISDRPYRKGLNLDDAIMELQKNSGVQFDKEIVDIFIYKILLEEDFLKEAAVSS